MTSEKSISIFIRNTENAFSIENIVKNITMKLAKEYKINIVRCKYPNYGTLNRIKNMLYARKNQGDINHISGDIHFISFLIKHRRTIITMHDCEKLMGSEYNWLKKVIYKLFWFKIPALCCRYIVTDTEESKRNLIKYAGITGHKVKVIYVGVDPVFRRVSGVKREKINLENPNKKKVVVHISAIQINKNIDRMISSLKGLDIKFVRVGALKEKHIQALKASGVDYITFENIDIEFLKDIYNQSDVLLFPSTIEGFGMPIIEAQGCGCAVVTSNCSTMPEVAGEGAYLINPYSVEDIHNGLKLVLNNRQLRKELVEKGFKNVKKFLWDQIALSYRDLYEMVMREKK